MSDPLTAMAILCNIFEKKLQGKQPIFKNQKISCIGSINPSLYNELLNLRKIFEFELCSLSSDSLEKLTKIDSLETDSSETLVLCGVPLPKGNQKTERLFIEVPNYKEGKTSINANGFLKDYLIPTQKVILLTLLKENGKVSRFY